MVITILNLFVSVIFLGLIVLQYPAWSAGIFFSENRTLLKQVESFSQKFSDKDLILVDRNATGDCFSKSSTILPRTMVSPKTRMANMLPSSTAACPIKD